MVLGVIFVYLAVHRALQLAGQLDRRQPTVGAGVYGVINRLLLPFGLHHIPNSLWFQFGSYTDASGKVVHGDLAGSSPVTRTPVAS